MTRTSAIYGVWAAFCAALTFLPLVPMHDLSGPALKSITEVVVMTWIFSTLGWQIFHRRGRQPSGWGYCLLAVLVVIVIHLWIVGRFALASHTIAKGLGLLVTPLILHAWFTIPTALLATFLFVAARRRWPTAEPSGPWPGRSRS